MDDLISREAALDAIRKYDFFFPQYMERFVTELRDAMKSDLVNDIKNLPSAQTLVKCVAKVTMTDEQVREAFENAKLDFIAAAQPTQLDLDKAYMRGKVDGIRQCTEKLRKLRESINV